MAIVHRTRARMGNLLMPISTNTTESMDLLEITLQNPTLITAHTPQHITNTPEHIIGCSHSRARKVSSYIINSFIISNSCISIIINSSSSSIHNTHYHG